MTSNKFGDEHACRSKVLALPDLIVVVGEKVIERSSVGQRMTCATDKKNSTSRENLHHWWKFDVADEYPAWSLMLLHPRYSPSSPEKISIVGEKLTWQTINLIGGRCSYICNMTLHLLGSPWSLSVWSWFVQTIYAHDRRLRVLKLIGWNKTVTPEDQDSNSGSGRGRWPWEEIMLWHWDANHARRTVRVMPELWGPK